MNYSDFTKFHYVEMVAEERNITRAAQRLYISQPALTKSIAKLEQELGVKLFDRSTTPLQLTYAGERYLEGMKNISAMKYQLDRELEDIANMRRERLIIGIPETRSQRWLSTVLPLFLREYPGVDLRVREKNSTGELESDLVADRIDLALVITLPMMVPGLDYEVIRKEQIMVLASPKHPMFADLDLSSVDLMERVLHYIRPERLDGQPYIASLPEQGLARIADQLFERFSITPKTVLELSNTSTARALARDNVGFVVTPTHTILARKMRDAEMACCTITDPPTERTIIAAYKKDRVLSNAARRFIDVVKQAALTMPALQDVNFPVVYDLEDKDSDSF